MRNACAQLITRLPDSRVSKSPPIGLSYAGHEFDRSGREREARIVFAFTQASPSSNPDPLRGATSVRKEFSSLAALFRPWTEFSSNRGVHRLGKSSSEHLLMFSSPHSSQMSCEDATPLALIGFGFIWCGISGPSTINHRFAARSARLRTLAHVRGILERLLRILNFKTSGCRVRRFRRWVLRTRTN